MVRALLIEIPIQFIRNLPRIKIEFDDVIDETNLNKLVHIKLTNRDNPTNELSSWYFTHCLQETNIIEFSGVDYGNYLLEVHPISNNNNNNNTNDTENETIHVSYKVICLENEWSRDTIVADNTNDVDIAVSSYNTNNARWGGSLMTSGSFTMMAAGGGLKS